MGNKDGLLSLQEMREGMTEVGIPIPADIEDVIAHVDTDGSGGIDYTEFIAAMMSPELYKREHMIKGAFRTIDKDNDSAITKADIKTLLSLGSSKALELVKSGDINNDKEISIE